MQRHESHRRSARRRFLFSVGPILLLVGIRPGIGQTADPAAEPRSIQQGVYTEKQARRGERVMDEVCTVCHAVDYYQGSFLNSWTGTNLNALFELISTTMPDDSPGGLKRRQYADVLAYILELNGVPAGEEELDSKKSSLEKILIEWRR